MGPQVDLLLRKAQEDREALDFHLADTIFGFHAQQAFEKIFKAVIAFRNARYERTHDLAVLLEERNLLGEGPLPPLTTLQMKVWSWMTNA